MDFLDPSQLEDSAVGNLMQDLGQKAELEGHLAELRERLQSLPEHTPPLQRAGLLLDAARTLQILERGDEAWPLGRTAFELYAEQEEWEPAADTCDVLYQSGQPDSLVALGNGIWLAVTFPIDPEISVHLLSHVIDDTPDDSDGAAVAAATALFIADIRCDADTDGERLRFFANQLMGRVARRHSDVESQEQFELWVERLELNDPDKFLVRLRNVVDVLAQDQWWIDRDAIRARLDGE